MSFGFLTRLNIEFYSLAESKINKDVKTWVDFLLIIFTELSGYIKKSKDESEEERKKRMYKEIKDLTNIVSLTINSKTKSIPSELFWRMVDFELELRCVMKENNIELKMSDDPRLAI